MEVIKKKYKYKCENCKTDILDLSFEDFKKETLEDSPRIRFPFISSEFFVCECPVCKKKFLLNECEIYKQYKIVNKEEIVEVSNED